MGIPIVDDLLGIPGDIASDLAGSILEEIFNAIFEAVGKLVASLATIWVRIPTPEVASAGSGSVAPSESVAFIQRSMWWLTAIAATAGLIYGGARMAWLQRGDDARLLVQGMIRLALAAVMGVAVIALGADFGDRFSTWIIDGAADGDFGRNMTVLLGLGGGAAAASGALGVMLGIILGLIMIIEIIIQIALMVLRGAILVVLAGVIPFAAATAMTGDPDAGLMWRRVKGWVIAFLAYKPAAAVIYATAISLAGEDPDSGQGLVSIITGLALMTMALLALPALLRLVSPAPGGPLSGLSSGHVAAAGATIAAHQWLSSGGNGDQPTGASKDTPKGGDSPSGSSNGGDPRPTPSGGSDRAQAGTRSGGGRTATAGAAGAGGSAAAAGAGAAAGTAAELAAGGAEAVQKGTREAADTPSGAPAAAERGSDSTNGSAGASSERPTGSSGSESGSRGSGPTDKAGGNEGPTGAPKGT